MMKESDFLLERSIDSSVTYLHFAPLVSNHSPPSQLPDHGAHVHTQVASPWCGICVVLLSAISFKGAPAEKLRGLAASAAEVMWTTFFARTAGCWVLALSPLAVWVTGAGVVGLRVPSALTGSTV